MRCASVPRVLLQGQRHCMQMSHSLTRCWLTSGPNSRMRRFIVSKEARARWSSVGFKTCIVRCSDSGFYLKKNFLQHCWEVLPSYIIETCRSLSDEYDGNLGDLISRASDSSRRQTWREDEHDLHSTRSQGITTNSSLLENDLKVRKCHALLFLNLHKPKMDVNLTISFKKHT